MLIKERLLTPGPTQIPARVHAAMAKGDIHHRTPEFEAIFASTLKSYQQLIDSPTLPIFLAGTGTAAMDATLQNIAKAGDKIIVLNGGKFGERWIELAAAQKLECVQICAEWGGTIDFSELEIVLKNNQDAVAFCCQYCETSTTALHPVTEIGKILSKQAPDMLFVVDGITAVGVKPVSMQQQAIDILICGSQKALMLPPGLAMISLSERAWTKVKEVKTSAYYFNFLREYSAHQKNTTAYTPAISLIRGLAEALLMLNEEGLENTYLRHQKLSQAVRAGVKAMGFETVSDHCPAPGVTGFFAPAGLNAKEIKKVALKKFGARLAGGQGQWTDTIIRFGHMGYIDTLDVISGLSALEMSLQICGAKLSSGSGVAVAQAILID